jgi:hypothetical protein
MTAGAVLLGVLIAIGFVLGIVIPRFGLPGDLNRVATLGRLLESPDRPVDAVLIVTNSVGVEGVSAKIVQSAAGDACTVENFSANGLDLIGARLLIGKMLASEPDTIVWILRPEVIGAVRGLNQELADVMRLGGFQAAASWLDAPPLSEDTLDRLQAPAWKNRLALRSVPLRLLSERVRTAARSGILPAKPDNLDAPFQMDLNLTDEALDRHLDDMAFNLDQRVGAGDRTGIAFIQSTVAQIRAAGVNPVLIVAPTHPGLADHFGSAERELLDALSAIAAEHDAIVIDATATLTAEEFADAIHPNQQGRAALSRFIGRRLAAASVVSPTPGQLPGR